MNRELRERILLPAAVPIGATLAIAVAVFGFSRVLLVAPKEVAVAVALMMAVNILVVCALVATPPRGIRINPVLLIGAALVPVVLGLGAAANVRSEREGESARPTQPQVIEIGAANIAFDKTQLTVKAGKESVIEFDNREAQPHNVAIFAGSDALGEKLFTGEIITGPKSIVYQVPALPAGSHFFRCDVHPTQMTGTIVAEKAAEPAKATPAKASISANKLTFSTGSLSFPADSSLVLEFDNREALPHNVAIFEGADESGKKVFTGDLITGPRKISYQVTALAAGNYFFRCDVHPTTMRGSIKVG